MAATIRRPATWESQAPKVGTGGGRERALRALERHPVRTPEEVRRADATVGPILAKQAEEMSKLATASTLIGIVIASFGGTFIAIAVMAAIGALVTGTGFTFRPFGVTLVNRRGKRISRVRGLWRVALTWCPMVALYFVFKLGPDVTSANPVFMALDLALVAVLAAGAAWAIAHPSRGIQDRLAGTWIVPR
jgi:hypothetical protein